MCRIPGTAPAETVSASKRTCREPPLDLRQPIMAPERLAIDEQERGAEYAASHRGIDLRPELFLDRRLLDRLQGPLGIDPDLAQHVHQHRVVPKTTTADEGGSERGGQGRGCAFR